MICQYKHSSLNEAEDTLGFILDIVSDGIWDWNSLSGHVERSPGWYRMLGYDVDSFDKDVFTWENLIHPDDYTRVMKHFEAYIKGESEEYKIEYRCKKEDGNYLWVEDTGKIVERTEDGKLARMIGAHTNIDDAKIAEEKLRRQNELLLIDNASLEVSIEKRTQELESLNKRLEEQVKKAEHNAAFDVLTSTYNRRMFEEIFKKEMSRAKRYTHPLSIILLDIDEFKFFNDEYGHKTGDEILCAIVDILRKNLRESDSLARWGGDEFIIILPNMSVQDTKEKAERIRCSIAETKFVHSLKMTCSFGVTSYIEDESSDDIFVRADNALYRAKDRGRNLVEVL